MISKKLLTKINTFLEDYKSPILTIIYAAIGGDILFFGHSEDLRIFSIIALYVFAIWFYKLRSRLTFTFALWILGLMFILLIFTSTSKSTEKAAVWLFLFIAIGIVQQLKDENL